MPATTEKTAKPTDAIAARTEMRRSFSFLRIDFAAHAIASIAPMIAPQLNERASRDQKKREAAVTNGGKSGASHPQLCDSSSAAATISFLPNVKDEPRLW